MIILNINYYLIIIIIISQLRLSTRSPKRRFQCGLLSFSTETNIGLLLTNENTDIFRKGPPFQSKQFHEYCEYAGIHHRKITPRHPQANGEVERYMKTLRKCIRGAAVNKQSWEQQIHIMLRSYRSTPHTSTKLSPYEILFRRKMRTRLP